MSEQAAAVTAWCDDVNALNSRIQGFISTCGEACILQTAFRVCVQKQRHRTCHQASLFCAGSGLLVANTHGCMLLSSAVSTENKWYC